MRELAISGGAIRDAGIDGTSVLRGFILLDDGSVHYSRPNPFAPVPTEGAAAPRARAMFGGWGRLIGRAAAPAIVVGACGVVLGILIWATPLLLRAAFLVGVAVVAEAARRRAVKLIRTRKTVCNPTNLIARAIVTASYGSVERYTMLVKVAIVSAGLVTATAAAVGGIVVLTTDGYWRGLEIVLSIISGGAVGTTTLLALTVIHVGPSSHRVIAAGDLAALRRRAPRQLRGRHRRGK
jgi:hypothetical protein